MDFKSLFSDKNLKAKQKTQVLSQWVLENPGQADALIDFAKTAKDAEKATCIEAFEFATRADAATIGTANCFDFAASSLADKAPRVKWESAKVVGNIARLHPGRLENAIGHLLENAAHEGTVVRWSAAFALGEIIKLRTAWNSDLIPAAENICQGEPENSVRKFYLAAFKKVSKAGEPQ